MTKSLLFSTSCDTDLYEFPSVTVELLVLLVSQGEVHGQSRVTAHVGKMR